MGQRMFVAALPPEDLVEEIDEFLEPRREAARAAFRWTQPEQWHLTLAFLPDVADRRYDALVENLGRAAAKRSPLQLSVRRGGALPDVARAKVLWLGVEADDPDELDALAAGCRSAATTAGVETPAERFRPHLTVARTGHPVEATRWVRVLDAFDTIPFVLDEVVLIASHLGEGPRRRPRYEVLETFPLSGPDQRAW